ncbi:hypothetical protein IEN85_13490 [Pelagicoccus sp. NFK12]|uniref:Uncharacterized protein n=1 Tax=Pelagicoccus enzymogenes TaxID=2773457 RepID=A0A927II88_9BACT|nr:hypothetical protein [Pelagicoccus enzymogenes]MBD5780508.1 hypothetical protein [Pelagicoccus enzymogenes]
MSSQQRPASPKSFWKGKALPTLRNVLIVTLVLGLLAVEFGPQSAYVKYTFYGLIALYLGSIGLRAFRYRKHILYFFAPGTKEALGGDFKRANQILKDELNRLSEGYEIGFVKAFASEFRQIDKSARNEPTAIDKVLDFVEYAFPLQSNLISVLSKPLKGAVSKRSFRVSIAVHPDGNVSLHTFSQNDLTHDIQVDDPELESCLREAACRMYHEMNATELTSNYAAFRHYDQAFRIWEKIYKTGETDSEEFEEAAQQFRLALQEDPDFILAELYLAAMNAYRRTNTAYLERSKLRLTHVLQLCEERELLPSKSQRAKYKGLATALLCFITNQWLHRIGKYDNEEQAILIARDNQLKAKQAVKLLKDSPIAIHQFAFSLHSLEQIGLQNPQSPREIASSYADAYDQYTLAIQVAKEKRMPRIVELSSGNRAYVSMWLGALLSRDPDAEIRLKAFSGDRLLHSEAASKLWIQAESEMKEVFASATGSAGHYSIANLILLYALMGRFKEIPACGHLLLFGKTAAERPNATDDLTEQVAQLHPSQTDYPEGANDLASALLTACASGTLKKEDYLEWLAQGLAFHARSIRLIQEKEVQNVEAQRIRIIKQITNLLKVIHYTKPHPSSNAGSIFQTLNQCLNKLRSEQESMDTFISTWLTALESALRSQIESTSLKG